MQNFEANPFHPTAGKSRIYYKLHVLTFLIQVK